MTAYIKKLEVENEDGVTLLSIKNKKFDEGIVYATEIIKQKDSDTKTRSKLKKFLMDLDKELEDYLTI